MSTNLRVNERSKKSFSVTRYSGFDGVRVQVTTARDSKEELDFTDKFFNTVNLNRNEAIDLAHALMAFVLLIYLVCFFHQVHMLTCL